MAFRIDRSLNDYLDLAAELLADETTPQFERGVFEMTAWTVGLNLSDPNDRGYLAVRLHLDLDLLYPPDGTETIIFHWHRKHGDCLDCGRPAAFRATEAYGRKIDGPILCAVCAANYAADGELIERLTPDNDDADPTTLPSTSRNEPHLSVGTDAHGSPAVRVTVYDGDDGVPVVQLDTAPSAGRVRVNVNDGTVFDADPEGSNPAGENPETRYFATGAAGDRMNYTATDDAQALDIARQANSPRSLTHYWGVWRADDGSYVGDVPATS